MLNEIIEGDCLEKIKDIPADFFPLPLAIFPFQLNLWTPFPSGFMWAGCLI